MIFVASSSDGSSKETHVGGPYVIIIGTLSNWDLIRGTPIFGLSDPELDSHHTH